jgi:DSF synthase
MNAIVSPSVLATRRSSEVIENANGSAIFDISPQLSCNYDRGTGTLWSSWRPTGVPSFNTELLSDLERGSQVIEGYFRDSEDCSRSLHYIVLTSDVRNAFNVGGDLGYFQRLIVARDRARLTAYSRAAVDAIHRNYCAHGLSGVTTIALLEGDALGGGLECALSCDIVVVERHIKAGFPEVLFDMFPGMGGISFLSRRVNRRVVDEMVRSGRQYSAQELFELGIVDLVVDTGQGRDAIKALIHRRTHQQSAHAAISAVERMVRPVTLAELHEVVRLWVDSAMNLSPRGLEWMQRLYQRQLSVFGAGLAIAPSFSSERTEIAQAA